LFLFQIGYGYICSLEHNLEFLSNHIVAKFKQHPGSYDAIDGFNVLFTYRYFIQVETDQLPSARMQLFDEIIDLSSLKTTRYRCAGIGTQFWIKSVDIKTDIYLFGQIVDNLLTDLLPATPLELFLFYFLVEPGPNPL